MLNLPKNVIILKCHQLHAKLSTLAGATTPPVQKTKEISFVVLNILNLGQLRVGTSSINCIPYVGLILANL